MTLKTDFVVQGHIVSFIFITWRRLEKHTNHIVFRFHQLSFMLVIQLSYSDSRMPVKSYYYLSMSPFWTFCARAPSGFENEQNMQRVIAFCAP